MREIRRIGGGLGFRRHLSASVRQRVPAQEVVAPARQGRKFAQLLAVFPNDHAAIPRAAAGIEVDGESGRAGFLDHLDLLERQPRVRARIDGQLGRPLRRRQVRGNRERDVVCPIIRHLPVFFFFVELEPVRIRLDDPVLERFLHVIRPEVGGISGNVCVRPQLFGKNGPVHGVRTLFIEPKLLLVNPEMVAPVAAQ